MTNREFYMAVLTLENIDETLVVFAKEAIAKLDKANARKASTLSKEQVANEGIKSKILELLAETSMTASAIGSALEISTQKASALCRQLVEVGALTSTEVKVNKSKVKAYALNEENE